MRFLFCFFDPYNEKKTVVSLDKNKFEIIQHNTVIIFVFSVIQCFFGDNLQGPTLFINRSTFNRVREICRGNNSGEEI